MTNVIYDKETKRVIVIELDNGNWILPAEWDLATFKNGVEPMLRDVNGNIFLDPKSILLPPDFLK